jgi:hypothetical protein
LEETAGVDSIRRRRLGAAAGMKLKTDARRTPAESPELRMIASKALVRLRKVSGNRHIEFGSDLVHWLDAFVEHERVGNRDFANTADALIEELGCVLGECIISTYGGAWTNTRGTWAVEFSPGNGVLPFDRLEEQVNNGRKNSIARMFEVIPMVFPGLTTLSQFPYRSEVRISGVRTPLF